MFKKRSSRRCFELAAKSFNKNISLRIKVLKKLFEKKYKTVNDFDKHFEEEFVLDPF